MFLRWCDSLALFGASYGARRFAATHSARLDRAAAVVHSGLHACVPAQLRERGELDHQLAALDGFVLRDLLSFCVCLLWS